jgi:predicted GTPase
MRVQRFASLDDIDASHPTIEEREEYEGPVEHGMTVFAGVDYAAVLAAAEQDADVILWDGGNNDFPFIRPDRLIVVVDPLRAGQELHYHPGETNLRMADVVLVNKLDSAGPAAPERVYADIGLANPTATIVRAASPVTLDDGPAIKGRCVLVVEDGPTLTHGGMPFGAGTVAAVHAGVGMRIDPRTTAVGSIAEVFEDYPYIGSVLPAMGYGDAQLAELEATINATDCDVVISGTSVDLSRLIHSRHPIRHVRYELEEIGRPTLADVLAPIVSLAVEEQASVAVRRVAR